MADPSLEALLDVQAHDLAIDQLRYRRQALPEREALRDVRTDMTAIEQSRAVAAARRGELERAQRRLEDEIEGTEAKAAASQSRLYGGEVQAPRELQALATEVESLRSRTHAQEDELLEVMESSEALAAELDGLDARARDLAGEGGRLAQVLTEQEGEIDRELAAEVAARNGVADEVPAALLATYEGLRRRLDGIGAARVEAGRCTGCHLSLSAVELDALRRAADGQVVCHEDCGRILVP